MPMKLNFRTALQLMFHSYHYTGQRKIMMMMIQHFVLFLHCDAG